MVLACLKGRYLGGLSITDPTRIEEVCVQAATSVGAGSEGGINRVEFYISYGNSAPITATTTVLEECFPTHAQAASIIPGAPADTLAAFPGYKIQLALIDLPKGKITITATAFSNAGTATNLDLPIVIHNDTDGFDRRPVDKIVWVDFVNGSDVSGNGDETNPYKTPQKALQGEMGGAVVKIKAGPGVWTNSPGSYSQWWTSNDHRVTFEFLPGALMSRLDHPDVVYNGTMPGTKCNYYFKNSQWLNHGGVIGNDPSVPCDIWLDGGLKQGQHWTSMKRWSCLTFRKDPVTDWDLDGQVMTVTQPGPEARIHATCFRWRGVVNGPNSFFSEQDCVVSDFLGIGSYFFDRHTACNCIIEGQRLYSGVAGRVQGNISNSVVSIPAAGQMRIDATGNQFYDSSGNSLPMDIGTLAEIAGTDHQFRVRVQGATAGGNNGDFVVISAGSVGNFGFPYVVLANPSAVAGAPGASTLLWTISLRSIAAGQAANDFVHPDVLYMAGNLQENTFLYGITARDIDGAQTFFTSGHSDSTPEVPIPNIQSRLCMWNCRDGGNYELSCMHFGTRFLDCLFFNNTIEGLWPQNPAWGAATGTCFINNVIGGFQAGGANFWPGMLTVDGNHLISGTPAYGTNWTTGPWFDTNPRVTPWSFKPLSAHLGTGSALVPELTARRWPGASGPTKGCLFDTGEFFWSLEDQPLSATSLGTSADSAALAVHHPLAGSSSGTSVDTAAPLQKYVLQAVSFGTSRDLAHLLVGKTGLLQAFSAGTSSDSASLLLTHTLSATSSGTSEDHAFLASITDHFLEAISVGTSVDTASLIINIVQVVAGVATPRPFMKQRIYNALLAVVRAGPYYACSINPKTGQMTVFADKPVVPVLGNIVIRERNKSYRLAARFKREFNVSELESWSWTARVEFPAQEVACEVFEESITDTGITIPPVEGLVGQRTLLARFDRSDYSHPASQSPNTGTVAEFSFEIIPETLRK